MTVAEEVVDWTNADYADGPAVAEWIKRHVGVVEQHTSFARRLYAWSKGDTASVETLDRHLTARCVHLSELPDHVWRKGAYRPPRGTWAPNTRAQVAALMAEGFGVVEIARKLDRLPDSIRYHVRKLEANK